MNPFQQAAIRRKIFYVGLILVLYTISMFWRGTIPIPLSGARPERQNALTRLADRIAGKTIKTQAIKLEVWELDPEQNEVDLAGSTAQVAMLGVRGFVVAYLWQNAIDQQKRNDFHELEVSVRAVTSLQPHFITPWIFQSWNIAYNVSVELKHPGDMYFYIARGIELLAEGERRNKKSPDMRFQIGFYYQNKFGVSDDVQVLRCLYQLSCLPPAERNTANLIDPRTGEENYAGFRQFCERNPHLVRRLEEKLNCRTPMDVIAFIRDNQTLPSRYRKGNELADAESQFPILPPKYDEARDEVNPGTAYAPGNDTLTGFKAARAWFTYANSIVPPYPPDADGNPIPGPSPTNYDQLKYRMPRQPMLIIFRQGPRPRPIVSSGTRRERRLVR